MKKATNNRVRWERHRGRRKETWNHVEKDEESKNNRVRWERHRGRLIETWNHVEKDEESSKQQSALGKTQRQT